MAKVYVTQPARRNVKEPEVQMALDDIHNAILPHTRANEIYQLAYKPTVTPNLGVGNIQVLSVTDSQPFTIANPIGVGTTGKHVQVKPNALWTLVITNDNSPNYEPATNDGVLRPTFGSSFVVAPFTSPPAGGAAVAQFVTIIRGTVVKHFQVGAWSTR